MSYLCGCCTKCVEFCLSKVQKKKAYAGIKYRPPQEANVAVRTPEIPRFPMTKSFDFPQQQVEMPLHPQLSQGQEKVVSQQPRGRKSMTLSSPPEFVDHSPRARSLTFPGRPTSCDEGASQPRFDTALSLRPRADTFDYDMLRPHSPHWRRSASAPHTGFHFGESFPTSTLGLPFGVSHSRQHSEGAISIGTAESRSRASSFEAGADIYMSSETTDEPDGRTQMPPLYFGSSLPTRVEGKPALIHFSLYYNVQNHTLTVSLIRAENLPPGPSIGSYQPYVVLYLYPNKVEIHESKVRQDDLDPSFGESFEFQKLMPDEIRRQNLVLHIYNTKKTKYLLGTAVVPLGQVDMFGIPLRAVIDSEAKEFRKPSKGNLLLSLKYIPQQDQIKGVVLKATNLQKQDLVGSADPYVKIYLMCEGRRLAKWKTTIRKNTLIPIFNERFQFHVPHMDLSSVVLEIRVIDYDRFTPNDLMGVVLIGENVPQDSGREHWVEMISSVNQSVSNWHSLLPETVLNFRTMY